MSVTLALDESMHYHMCVIAKCSGTLGVGFYGNEEMKKGDNSMYAAASEARDIVSDIHMQVQEYN